MKGEFSHGHKEFEALAVITLRFGLIISRKTAFYFLQVDHIHKTIYIFDSMFPIEVSGLKLQLKSL